MATTIVTKYGSDAPAASDIVRGELAVDTENGRLYTENAAGAVVEIGLKPEANVDVTGTITASGVVTANAGVVVDNFTLDGTTLALSSGDLTLDVAGEIILDADGTGTIRFNDGGTNFGMVFGDSSNFTLISKVQDKDMIFQGNDGGSTITMLTLDASAAGAAIFNSSVTATSLTATNNGITLQSASTTKSAMNVAASTNQGINGTAAGDQYNWTTGGKMLWSTNSGTNAHLVLDGSGNVGIGIAPTNSMHIKAAANTNPLRIQATTDDYNYATIQNAAGTDVGYLGLGIALISGGAATDFTVRSQSNLVFTSGGADEAARFDSSQTFLVGKTEDGISNAGHVLFGTGAAYHIRDGGFTNFFNRTSSDGEILRFAKDGTTVGNIGTHSASTYIGKGDTGLYFNNGNNSIDPYNTSTPAPRGDSISLGAASRRFADLYLSSDIAHLDASGTARLLYDKSVNLLGNAGTNVEAYNVTATNEINLGTFSSTGGTTGTEFISGEMHSSYNGTAPRKQVYIYNPNGEVGSIESSFTSCNFNTSSDYRLKENVVYEWDATTRLKQLKPARFNFISHADRTVDGFLAHEVSSVIPEAVSGTKDAMKDEEYEVTPAVEEVRDDEGNITTEAVEAVMSTRSVPDMQGIDQSKLVPLLVKTIQELEARITALEA